MLKRKYGDRSNWQRIVDREFTQSFYNTNDFKGYITLLKMNKVKEPLFVSYDNYQVCLVDDGYIWLQHFPWQKNYSITTTFDEKGRIIQWYIDITKENGVENNRPWMDDLFLDLVVLPNGNLYVLDEDELDEALDKGMIDHRLYELAWRETKRLKKLIVNGNFHLLKLTREHKTELLGKL